MASAAAAETVAVDFCSPVAPLRSRHLGIIMTVVTVNAFSAVFHVFVLALDLRICRYNRTRENQNNQRKYVFFIRTLLYCLISMNNYNCPRTGVKNISAQIPIDFSEE